MSSLGGRVTARGWPYAAKFETRSHGLAFCSTLDDERRGEGPGAMDAADGEREEKGALPCGAAVDTSLGIQLRGRQLAHAIVGVERAVTCPSDSIGPAGQ